MNVTEFCQHCTGKWFSQRTTHAVPPGEMEASRADLYVDSLGADDPDAAKAIAAISADPTAAVALRSRWEGVVGANPNKQNGSAIVAFVPETDTTGEWVQQVPGQDAIAGRYELVNGQNLTLTATTDKFTTEERWWFAGDNLRERTSIISYPDGTRIASFFSEIRLGQAQNKSDA